MMRMILMKMKTKMKTKTSIVWIAMTNNPFYRR
jgi:hypothetical protein